MTCKIAHAYLLVCKARGERPTLEGLSRYEREVYG